MLNREKTGALFFLLFSLAYGYEATNIPLTFLAKQGVLNSRTMPYALAIAGALVSFLILILPSIDNEGRLKFSDITKGFDWKRTINLFILMVFYGVGIKWLGFIVGSILFLFAGFRVMGEKRLKTTLLWSIGVVVVLWVILAKLLGMYISPGEIYYILGGE